MKNHSEVNMIQQLKKIGSKSFRIDFEWGSIYTNEVATRYTYDVYVATLKNNTLHEIGCNSEEKILDRFITAAKCGKTDI